MADRDRDRSIEDFVNKFDHFRRIPDTGNVLIHPGLTYNFIELKAEFVDQLKDDIKKKIMMAGIGVRELSPTEIFAMMMLDDAY